MALSNDIVLRPRFKFEIAKPNEALLDAFKNAKSTQSNFILTIIDDHVFIKFPKEKQSYWSPQLHLEINTIDSNTSIIYGLFGPNPTVWTLFMFFHFIIASIFIAFGIWAYTNWSLDKDYTVQFSMMLLMVIIWIGLYFAGSIGKASTKPEMHLLNNFIQDVLKKEKL